MLKIAVVGTGRIGVDHFRAIKQSKDCILCAVCDINKDAVIPVAEEFGVPYFTDYKDIVREIEADAVIINLPHWLHCEATEFFLDHGIHVLVEKPMANSVEECDRMIAAAERNQCKLAIGHLQRFRDVIRKVKEIVQTGELGKMCMYVEYDTSDYFIPERPRWFLDKRLAGGGITMNFGAHALDKLFYILESRPTELKAILGNIKNDCSIEGHAQVLIKFKNDVSATINFSAYNLCDQEEIFFFTGGMLKVSGLQVFKNIGFGWEEVEIEKRQDTFVRQLEEFCKYVKGQESEVVTGDYARQIIAAIEKIYTDN